MDDNQGLAALLRALASCDYQRDVGTIRNLLFEILSLATNGANIKPALPVVVKLLAHPDAFVKRVTGEIMSINAEDNPDITLLGINTLVQDCKDVNPVVRGISFRTLGSLRTSAVSEVLDKCIVGGLADKNGYVRRSAALASISLNTISSSAVLEGEIWNLLYQHLRDEDAATVASCLCSLEEVCAKEKGIVMSNKLGQYLIDGMPGFSPTVQRIILQFLLKFSPKTKDQMFDHLNYLDDNLTKAESFAMVFCAYELFHHFTQNVPRARKKLTTSAWTSIKTNMARERNEEMTSAAIHYMDSVSFPVGDCSSEFCRFLCRDDDSLYITHQKIQILSKMVTTENVDQIFSEYLSRVRTMSLRDMTHLVRKVPEIMVEKPDVFQACVDFLKNLISTDKTEVINEVLQILPSITLEEEEQWKEILALAKDKFALITSMDAKTAILQIMRKHPLHAENMVEILEEMFSELDQSSGENSGQDMGGGGLDLYKVNLLSVIVNIFLLRPCRMQPILAKIMEYCLKDCDYFVKDKALLYYGFLLHRIKQTV